MPGTRNQATSVADDFRIFATCRNLISPLTDRLTSALVMVHNTRPRSWTRPMWNAPNPRDSHVGRGRPTGHSTGHTLAEFHAFPFRLPPLLPGHRPLKAEIAGLNPARATVPRQAFLPNWRQLVMPVHLLVLTTVLTALLSCIGPVAWDVELQDD